MIRFWVGLGKPSEQSCPTSNDVKSLFKDYGTVEDCQVKLNQVWSLFGTLFTIKDRCKKCVFNKRTIKVCVICF